MLGHTSEKPLIWIGSSKKVVMALSVGTRKSFGHTLNFSQNGAQHDAAKVRIFMPRQRLSWNDGVGLVPSAPPWLHLPFQFPF